MSVWLNWTMGLMVMKSVSCILLICPLSLMGYVEEKQEEQMERLIGELQDENEDVRWNAVEALRQIGTPEALKAVEEYQSRQ